MAALALALAASAQQAEQVEFAPRPSLVVDLLALGGAAAKEIPPRLGVALRYFEEALALQPTNENVIKMVERMRLKGIVPEEDGDEERLLHLKADL